MRGWLRRHHDGEAQHGHGQVGLSPRRCDHGFVHRFVRQRDLTSGEGPISCGLTGGFYLRESGTQRGLFCFQDFRIHRIRTVLKP